jgi:SAM-dependent methyltransferase
MNKPTAFIASSQESVSLVSELKAALKRTFEVLPWNAGTFRDGEYFLESLVKTAGRVDLAIFVFASDDTTITRDRRVMTARDNVVLEYGLFLGALGRKRVFVMRDSGTTLPTDLAGLTVRDLPSDPRARKAALNDFVKTVGEQLASSAPPVRRLPVEINDYGLGVKKTIAEAHRRLSKAERRVAPKAETDYIEFESNVSCVKTYCEALELVQGRFWTTTFVSSGFWIHSDQRIIAANQELLDRLGKGREIPNVRRLFLVHRSPEAELEIIKLRLIHLYQQERIEEAELMESQLAGLGNTILKLLESRCSIKVVQDLRGARAEMPLFKAFDPMDSEVAIYDDFRVDVFSGGRLGRIDNVKIYGIPSTNFSAIRAAAVEYFQSRWNHPRAIDAKWFLLSLEETLGLAQRHISYTSNWLAKFEFHLGNGDHQLKEAEKRRVREVLRKSARWGKIRRCLDIGTCTARYPIFLRDAISSSGKIIGIDSNQDCIEFAKANVKVLAGSDKRISIKESDFMSGVNDLGANFDLITCMLGTLAYFGWQESVLKAALRRMRSLLSASGWLILSNWSAEACERRDLLEIYDAADKRRLAQWTPKLAKLRSYLREQGLEEVREVSGQQLKSRLDVLVCARR